MNRILWPSPIIRISSWCPWCKKTKGMPKNCDYCFRAVTLPQIKEVIND